MGHNRPCLIPTRVPGPKVFHPASLLLPGFAATTTATTTSTVHPSSSSSSSLSSSAPSSTPVTVSSTPTWLAAAADYHRLVDPHPSTRQAPEPLTSVTAQGGVELQRTFTEAERYVERDSTVCSEHKCIVLIDYVMCERAAHHTRYLCTYVDICVCRVCPTNTGTPRLQLPAGPTSRCALRT
jgi:hypothetical protein